MTFGRSLGGQAEHRSASEILHEALGEQRGRYEHGVLGARAVQARGHGVGDDGAERQAGEQDRGRPGSSVHPIG